MFHSKKGEYFSQITQEEEYAMTSDAQKRANIKWKRKNYKRVPLDLKQDYYDAVKAFLDERGYKVNTYIKAALSEKLSRDGFSHTVGESQQDNAPLPLKTNKSTLKQRKGNKTQ